MLISDKQYSANRRNAQHSTGPITPEGKARVRLNALTYGFRARSNFIRTEDPEVYIQLWNEFLADWQPANHRERFELETMATSQWLLARLAKSENRVDDTMGNDFEEKYFRMLLTIARRRAQLERSYYTAMKTLKQLQ